ncbi:MAG: histidine phosphatase family protein [bacterium]|nr:histidine phosphatase family protein [bacterium]
MGWPRKLVLVRHAQSTGNLLTVEQRADLPEPAHEYELTELGCQQAEITGLYLKKRFCEFDACFSSHYLRARQTLAIAMPNAKAIEDSRLAEAQRGIWHRMNKEKVCQLYPGEVERREQEDLYQYRPIGGENWPDIEMRIHSFRQSLFLEHDDEKVLAIVHGNWFNLFQKVNDGLTAEEVLHRYKLDNHGVVDNASVTIYRGKSVNGKPRLVLEEENIVPWRVLEEI